MLAWPGITETLVILALVIGLFGGMGLVALVLRMMRGPESRRRQDKKQK
jgi:uncharacterized protein (DUF2062 family)